MSKFQRNNKRHKKKQRKPKTFKILKKSKKLFKRHPQKNNFSNKSRNNKRFL